MVSTINQELIDSIYSGALEQKPWQSFLRLFRISINCQVIDMWLQPPQMEMLSLSLKDIDADYKQLVKPFFSEYFLPSTIQSKTGVQGEVKLLSEIINTKDISSNKYYLKYLRPNKIFDAMQIFVEEPNGLQAWIGLGRAEGAPPFKEQDVALGYSLIPHLSRALEIYSTIKRAEAHAAIYEDLVERLTVGIIILDKNLRVIKTNNRANILLDDSDNMVLHDDRLHFLNAETQKSYITSIENILENSKNKNATTTVDLLRIQQARSNDIGLLIRSVTATQWYEGRACPAIILYVCDPSAYKKTRESLVSKLFGLTISEASLAILLADGLTLAEAAKKLNIQVNSARTVSKKIFSKTGVRRQAELIRLILNSVALLG